MSGAGGHARFSRRWRLALSLLALCSMLGCEAKRSEDAEARASRAAAQDAQSLRIAALSPAIGLILADLGLADRIVARHGFDRFLPASIPVGGDQAGLDYERLIAAQPTLVLLEWGARPLPGTLARLAAKRGWRVESFSLLSLDDVRSATRRIAALIEPWDAGAPERAEAVLRDFNRALAPQPDVGKALGRTLILYFTDPIGAAGPDAAIAQVVASLGGDLALPDSAAYVSLDAEDLLALDPDTILLLAPDADAAQAREDPASMLGAISRLNLRAIRQGRVGVITEPTSRSASLRLRGAAREIAEIARGFAKQPQDEAPKPVSEGSGS